MPASVQLEACLQRERHDSSSHRLVNPHEGGHECPLPGRSEKEPAGSGSRAAPGDPLRPVRRDQPVGASLAGASLAGASLAGASLAGASLAGASL
jgi:hypothetical protein